MPLTFVDIRTEVISRGFSGLDSGAGLTRLKRWVNAATHQIDELEPWTYLLTTTTGTAPLTISDLRDVESVAVTASLTTLDEMDRRSLVDAYSDLTQTGTPVYWYRSALAAISVYPANTSTSLTVRYYKVVADMTADADTPAMPDRFRDVIVEFTCAKAYRDRDNPEAAKECLEEGQRILDTMAVSQLQAPERQVLTGASEDL